jgi:hypothetical protein
MYCRFIQYVIHINTTPTFALFIGYSPLCKGGLGGIWFVKSTANPPKSPFFKGDFIAQSLCVGVILIHLSKEMCIAHYKVVLVMRGLNRHGSGGVKKKKRGQIYFPGFLGQRLK